MNGFWGDKRFVKRKRKKDTKIGREPIGLTKGRKYPGRNVLKPKFGVDTEVFENAVSGNINPEIREKLIISFLNLSSR